MPGTRGAGLLEGFLAAQRSRMADRLVPPASRKGRILDIGCGTPPVFLIQTRFFEKYGLDKRSPSVPKPAGGMPGLTLIRHDFDENTRLPFEDSFFDVVSMLAVIEHIRPEKVVPLLRQILRILKPGGMFLLTSPAPWAAGLLRSMARLGLVSSVEIGDHKARYDGPAMVALLREAGFRGEGVRFGYFELFMNLWVSARKAPYPRSKSRGRITTFLMGP